MRSWVGELENAGGKGRSNIAKGMEDGDQSHGPGREGRALRNDGKKVDANNRKIRNGRTWKLCTTQN